MSMVKYVPVDGKAHKYRGHVIPSTGLILEGPDAGLDDYAGVTREENVSQDEMADRTDPLPEAAEYAFQQSKDSALAITKSLNKKADQKLLSRFWKNCELAFAPKSLAAEVRRQASKFSSFDPKAIKNSISSLDKALGLRGLIQSVDVTVTSAELLALNATPKVLLQAPPTGYYNELRRVEFFMDYNSAAYTAIDAAEDLSVEYSGGGQLLQVETTGFLDQTSDQRRCGHHKDAHNVKTDAIELTLLSGEILSGDSDLKLRVDYRVVKLLM